MEKLSVGDVVFVNFPFSDLTNSKLRPAVIVAAVNNNDWILCQITSKSYADPLSIELISSDFSRGLLNIKSYIRPGKIFTAHESIIDKNVGALNRDKQILLVQCITSIIQN